MKEYKLLDKIENVEAFNAIGVAYVYDSELEAEYMQVNYHNEKGFIISCGGFSNAVFIPNP